MNRSGRDDRGKIIALDYERIAALSDNTTCVALTEKAREMLLTIAPQLAWRTRWLNADGTQISTDVRREAIGDWAASCIDALMNDENECENLRKCRDYSLNNSFTTIEPQNPYTDPEFVPDGYILPPWWVMGQNFDPVWSTLGMLPGDMLTDLERFPGGGFPPAPIVSGFARFRVNVLPGDELEIHFLTFPTAGAALLVKNSNPLTTETIDLHMDVVAAPPETMTPIAWHWYVDGTEGQYVDVTFVPTVQDEFIPIRYGGGVRKITLCRESAGGIMLRQNPEDPCQLEQSLDDGETWTLAFDYSLCIRPHEQVLLEAALKTLTDPLDPNTPDGSALWDSDDDDPNETAPLRQQVLCFACTKTVDVMLDAYIAAHDGNLSPATVGTFVMSVIAIFGALALPIVVAICIAIAFAALAAYVLFLATLTVEMASDPDIRHKMACMLYSHLLGRPATLENFRSAYDNRECLTADETTVATFFAAALWSPFGPQLHTAFMGLLGAGFGALNAGQDLEGDCSECGGETWCHEWLASDIAEEWEIVQGTYLPATNRIANGPAPAGGGWHVILRWPNGAWLPAGTVMTMVRYYFERYPNFETSEVVSDGTVTSPNNVVALNAGWKEIANPGAYSATERVITLYCATLTNGAQQSHFIHKVQCYGTGPNPFSHCDTC